MAPAPPLRCTACSTTHSADDDDDVYCPACVHAILHGARERHAAAKQIWWEARQNCTAHYQQRHDDNNDLGNRLLEYQHRQQALRTELEQLRQQCSQVARDTFALQAQNVARQEALHPEHLAHLRRQILARIHQNVVGYNTISTSTDTTTDGDALEDTTPDTSDASREIPSPRGALVDAIQAAQQHNRTLRFLWTIQVLDMLRLQVDEEDMFHAAVAEAPSTTTNTDKRNAKTVRGIGTISGLPLPHAGPELYGVLPAEELQSALRLVAQATHLAARCLGLVLPHPILLQPLPIDGDATANMRTSVLEQRMQEEMDLANVARDAPTTTPRGEGPYPAMTTTSDSMASLVSISSALLGGDAATAQPPLSMDPARVAQRIQHAVTAVLAEDVRCTTLYPMESDGIALALLQNNVLVLCLRAGVPIPQLYPGEALLLNLSALKQYCMDQVGSAALSLSNP